MRSCVHMNGRMDAFHPLEKIAQLTSQPRACGGYHQQSKNTVPQDRYRGAPLERVLAVFGCARFCMTLPYAIARLRSGMPPFGSIPQPGFSYGFMCACLNPQWMVPDSLRPQMCMHTARINEEEPQTCTTLLKTSNCSSEKLCICQTALLLTFLFRGLLCMPFVGRFDVRCSLSGSTPRVSRKKLIPRLTSLSSASSAATIVDATFVVHLKTLRP